MKITKFTTILIIVLVVFVLSACVNNAPTQPQPTSSGLVEPTLLESSTPTNPVETQVIEESKNIFIHLDNSVLFFPDQTALPQLSFAMMEMGFDVLSTNELPGSDKHFSFALLFDPSQETLSHFQSDNIERFLIVQENLDVTVERPSTVFEISPADRLFIAGYLSAMISNDWRVGGLLPPISYQNTNADKVFQNGVVFLCGRCAPTFGPIVKFPMTALLSNPEDNESTLQAYGEISTNKINTLYIPSSYLFDDLVILFKQSGVTIVSDAISGVDQSDWIDYAIVDNLSNLIMEAISKTDQQEELVTIPVEYSVFASSRELSPGKSNFIANMIQTLQAGFISPYQIPIE
ncbi:MAG: hypothetical protein CVU41_01240 [Chloroflexi bacterium HGW-Chloroflexi-3]|nr:MAG: hypothetical protein CVU41_01240 [Chloroflexi bacterium HGW-Chloroflexi-3]